MDAWRWEQLALRMMDLDVVWQWQIGALDSAVCIAWGCRARVFYSDGLSRMTNQAYPGGTRQRPITDTDITHIQQKNAPRSREEFVRVLDEDFFVPRATNTAPNASISGLTTIRTSGFYTWTCNASGGAGGYSYMWERSDAGASYYWVGGSTSYESWVDAASGPYFDLRCSATSGTQTGSNVHRVNVLIPQ